MRAINRNKIIAVMAAIVVFMVSMCTYSAEVNATNTSRTYYVYDAQSPSEDSIRDYTLWAVSDYNNTGNTRGIIDGEDRDVDWSKNGVVKTLGEYIDEEGNEQTSIGTGFIIGDHLIATAAHCVKNFTISEIMLFNANGTVSLSATPIEYHVPYDYFYDYSQYYPDQCDYALITVEEDLSDYNHFNLGTVLDTIAENELNIATTGFPEYVERDVNGESIDVLVNDHDTHNKYTSSGVLNSIGTYKLSYNNDTSGGNSGSPVYITETRGSYTYQTVIGICTQAHTPYNHGLRITTDQLHFYLNNPNKIYETEE